MEEIHSKSPRIGPTKSAMKPAAAAVEPPPKKQIPEKSSDFNPILNDKNKDKPKSKSCSTCKLFTLQN